MGQKVASKPNGLHGASGNDASHVQNGSTRETEQAQAVASPPQATEDNWLLSQAGSFADDPFWDEMMEFIKKDRLEMDAKYDELE